LGDLTGRHRRISNNFADGIYHLDLDHQVTFGNEMEFPSTSARNPPPNTSMQYIMSNNMINIGLYGGGFDRSAFSPRIY